LCMKSRDVEGCAPFLKALSDNTRWRIVQELLLSPLTVSVLGEKLKVSQYNTSKHLRILREAGIVETAKKGKHVHCQIVPAFRHRVAKDKAQLDLGCCVFRFEKTSC
jgi:DNA-binding transcriptional ArsR family regulator